jgi:Flp pilus assembly pilin Flp
VIETALLLGMIVCACMFCITALDKKIAGRWNAIANFFGAV